MKFYYPEGATPIDADEARGLIPKGVTLQSEVNELEERNIAEAELWAFGRKRKDWLTSSYVIRLHRKMFGHVWKWAGKYRTTNKNLGVDKSQIQNELKKLYDDVRYWIDHKTYPWNEIAVRFHHRLVFIHPFSNGNGRHSRMMADVLLYQNGQSRLTWGRTTLLAESKMRTAYISALKEADQGKIKTLIQFSLS